MNRTRVLISCVFFIGLISCFGMLGTPPLADWDEARHAANAFEMLQNKDWFNYTFYGQPDRWNAKPQAVIWSQAAFMSVFGFNEFAFRFPSALAAFLTGLCVYFIARRQAQLSTLASACSALVFYLLKGSVGYHTGRTGDMDAAFVLTLTMAALFARSPVFAGLALGLAFWVKGAAFVLFAPLIFALVLLELPEFHPKKIAAAASKMALAAFSLIGTWLFLQSQFGKVYTDEQFSGKSQIDTLFFYDIYTRAMHDTGLPSVRFDLVSYLDSISDLTSPFGFFLFPLAIFLVIHSWRRWSSLPWFEFPPSKSVFRFESVLLVFAILLPSLALLSMRARNAWYAAPIFPFLSILGICIYQRAVGLISQTRIIHTIAALVFLVAVLKQGRSVFFPALNPSRVALRELLQSSKDQLQNAEKIVVTRDLAQGEYATLLWASGKLPTIEAGSSPNTSGTPASPSAMPALFCSGNTCKLTWGH